MYTTCKHVGTDKDGQTVEFFAAAFSSLTAAIGGFKVTGNLGADGYGAQRSFNATGPRGVKGYFKQVYAATSGYFWASTDPSVNHLIMARSGIDEAKYGATTNDDLQEVHFKDSQPVLYYVLWAGEAGYQYTDAELQRLLDGVAASCFPDAAAIPPSPPPRAPPPPAPPACAQPCQDRTCLAFQSTPCALVAQPPWSCDCSGCCVDVELLPPSPMPPDPPAFPSPAPPPACATPCAGATCGDWHTETSPFSCFDFEQVHSSPHAPPRQLGSAVASAAP